MQVQKQGFTLIEVLIVIVLVALSATMAGPSYFNLVTKNRVAHAANDFMAAIAKARSSAISLKSTVSLEPLDGSWSNGWHVMIGQDADKEILAEFTIHESLTVKALNNNPLAFNAMGTKLSLINQKLTICAPSGVGREILITGVGATRSKNIDTNCNAG